MGTIQMGRKEDKFVALCHGRRPSGNVKSVGGNGGSPAFLQCTASCSRNCKYRVRWAECMTGYGRWR